MEEWIGALTTLTLVQGVVHDRISTSRVHLLVGRKGGTTGACHKGNNSNNDACNNTSGESSYSHNDREVQHRADRVSENAFRLGFLAFDGGTVGGILRVSEVARVSLIVAALVRNTSRHGAEEAILWTRLIHRGATTSSHVACVRVALVLQIAHGIIGGEFAASFRVANINSTVNLVVADNRLNVTLTTGGIALCSGARVRSSAVDPIEPARARSEIARIYGTVVVVVAGNRE